MKTQFPSSFVHQFREFTLGEHVVIPVEDLSFLVRCGLPCGHPWDKDVRSCGRFRIWDVPFGELILFYCPYVYEDAAMRRRNGLQESLS